jgi:phosphoribosylformimino-5-aminoimidazole carboxamide ribotide isomerase
VIIFPAIDIKNGKVVRLSQGKFDNVTIYSDDPVKVAKEWERQGAEWLHVVDLDGAQTGEVKNAETILKIAKSVKIPIQTGGGIRTIKEIDKLLTGGVKRVILGTKAIENQEFFKTYLEKWPQQVIVSLDCSNGMVTERGWTTTSKIKGTDFARELQRLGVGHIIFTDIARDGMLQGPNIKSIEDILNVVSIPVIASGGVSNLDDIKKLKTLVPKGLEGVIVGKALYEKRLDLKEALLLCSQKE